MTSFAVLNVVCPEIRIICMRKLTVYLKILYPIPQIMLAIF